MKLINYPCLYLLIPLLCGCGGIKDAPQLAPVDGTVTWQGNPLSDASIAFTPDSGPIAIGKTDSDGHFVLSTQGRPGAAIGEHRVTVQAFETPSEASKVGPDGESLIEPTSRIPAKFGEIANSGLTATVSRKASENKFTFDLKK